MSELMVIADNQHFKKEVLESNLPVLVDFWAPWCNPCKVILPYVKNIADRYSGKVKVVKVDIDDNSDIASQYGIRGIPALVLFKDGVELERTVGVQIESAYISFLEHHLPELKSAL